MHVYELFRTRLDALGWLVGFSLLAAIEEHTARGAFGSTLAKNDVAIRLAGLDAPEQIGRVERRGAMLKKDDFEKSSRTRTLEAENRWT